MKFHVLCGKENFWWQGQKLAFAIKECLLELGLEADLGDTTKGLNPRDTIIAMGHTAGGIGCIDTNWIGPVFVYNFTPVHYKALRWFKVLDRNKKSKFRIRAILDFCPLPEQIFKKFNFRYLFTPIGYHESFEKKIDSFEFDFSFYGTSSGRRGEFLDILSKKYSVTKLKFRGVDGDKEEPFIQDNLLRAKVHLHINQWMKCCNFPSTRFFQFLGPNKLPFLCEETDWTPLTPGVHYEIFRSEKELLEKAKILIEDRKRSEKLAESAYKFITTKYRMVDHLRKSLEKLKLL